MTIAFIGCRIPWEMKLDKGQRGKKMGKKASGFYNFHLEFRRYMTGINSQNCACDVGPDISWGLKLSKGEISFHYWGLLK